MLFLMQATKMQEGERRGRTPPPIYQHRAVALVKADTPEQAQRLFDQRFGEMVRTQFVMNPSIADIEAALATDVTVLGYGSRPTGQRLDPEMN